jgi:endonuclease/exonuclease/phosphatase family metal-dependent hydrolase
MRVATFNILHGRSPRDGRVDVDRFADAVHNLGADVLALQEVDRNQPRSSHADLTTVAAEAMAATEHRFVAAISGSPGAMWVAATGNEQPHTAAYGVALLSRYPVRSWQEVRLPALPGRVPWKWPGQRLPVLVRDEPRVAMAAVIETPHGEVTVVNTHLSFITWWGTRQLRVLLGWIGERHRPLIVAGDLNLGPSRVAGVSRMRALVSEPSFPADSPRVQIDHILGDGSLTLTPRRAMAHRLPLSDHRALSVDLG